MLWNAMLCALGERDKQCSEDVKGNPFVDEHYY